MLYGPAFDLSTAGGFTAWRVGGLLAVLTALMAIFTVTRHTRRRRTAGGPSCSASAPSAASALLTAAIAVAARSAAS